MAEANSIAGSGRKDHPESLETRLKKTLKKDSRIWENVVGHNEVDFLNQEVFPILLQCLIQVLEKTKSLNSFYTQSLTYNGIDYLTELLYNCNPRHPLRTKKSLLKIPFVKRWLIEHPWSKYGSGIGWSEAMAAVVIQAHFRAFLVRCRPDVQEMRTFWKVLKHEKIANNNESKEME